MNLGKYGLVALQNKKLDSIIYGLSTLFMSVQKVGGALVRPKGITRNLKDPYLIVHVVFSLSPLAMHT